MRYGLEFDTLRNKVALKKQLEPLSETVKKEVNDTKERFTPENAEREIERLTRLVELRQSLDSGNYPLSHYSSGEKDSYDRMVSLPIYKPTRGRERGLRFGVLHAILGSSEQLGRMGLRDVADQILIFDSQMPGGVPRQIPEETEMEDIHESRTD